MKKNARHLFTSNGGLGTRVKLLDRVGESPHQKGGTDRQTNKHKEFGES